MMAALNGVFPMLVEVDEVLFSLMVILGIMFIFLLQRSFRKTLPPRMSNEIEKMLTCPISHEPMRDPVTLVESGQTYDKESLCQALLHFPTLCPLTGQSFPGKLQYIDCLPTRQILTLFVGNEAYQKYDDSCFRRRYSAVTSNSKDYDTYEELEALLFGMNRRQIDLVSAQEMVTNTNQDDAVVVGFKAVLLYPATFCYGELHTDKDEALRAWKRADELGLSADADAGNIWALWLRGMQEAFKEEAFERAAQSFAMSAAEDHAGSRCSLGFLYLRGHGVPQDFEMAVKYYKEAAEQGNALAQQHLGDLYRVGDHVPQDYEKALEYFRLAASQGNVPAQLALARTFLGMACRTLMKRQ